MECKTGVIPEDWKERTIREMENAQLMGVRGFPGPPPKTLFSYDPQRTRKWFKRVSKLPHERQVLEMRKLYSEHSRQLSDPRKMFDTLQKQLSAVGIFSLTRHCAETKNFAQTLRC